MIVVANASPLHYLILIDHTHVLPALYGRVFVPPVVVTELAHDRAPELVRTWLANRPDWLQVQGPRDALLSVPHTLGPGEREAIALAVELSADVLLMDDRDGRREAENRNLAVLGTLGVLAGAAEMGFADLAVALDRLGRTNFRASEQLLQQLLVWNANRRAE